MKTKSKALILTLCAVLLVAASMLGTMAYLTSTDEVENTFTVGQVKIKLDEAQVNDDGKPIDKDGEVVDDPADAKRVKANSYKLLPGHTYTKDPMVTVLKGSEASYIKMTVTFSNAKELDDIFAPNGADMTKIFNGYNPTKWIYKDNTEDATANTRTYEFWYNGTVGAPDGDIALDALFDSITVPGTITNEQLATIEGMTITVNAYAIQADGFANAEAAWAAFDAK